jgi:uncharacterized protein
MRERADRLAVTLGSAALNNPYGHASLLNAVDQRLGEVQIVILGEGMDSSTLRNPALATPFLNRTVRPAAITTGSEQFPEIAGHPKDKPAAFACTEGAARSPPRGLRRSRCAWLHCGSNRRASYIRSAVLHRGSTH